jgi:hypothetical protein
MRLPKAESNPHVSQMATYGPEPLVKHSATDLSVAGHAGPVVYADVTCLLPVQSAGS